MMVHKYKDIGQVWCYDAYTHVGSKTQAKIEFGIADVEFDANDMYLWGYALGNVPSVIDNYYSDCDDQSIHMSDDGYLHIPDVDTFSQALESLESLERIYNK